MSVIPSVVAARRARFYRSIGAPPVDPPPDPPPPDGGVELLGVGSASDSLTTYPITAATTAGDYYVDPNAGTNGSGTFASPFNNLQSAINAASGGQTILVRAGTLAPSTRYNIGKSGLRIWNYGTERPILSGSNLGTLNGASRILRLTATNIHIKGFEVINVKQHTDSSSDQGVLMESGAGGSLVEDVWMHDCPGGSFYMFAVNNARYQDCVFWNNGNVDEAHTNVADGFVTTGEGDDNVFVRCFSAHAPDDGFDMWSGRRHTFKDCGVYRTGYYYNGNLAGDGGGYKMGGHSNSGDGTLRGCIAIANRNVGLNNNDARPGPTAYINNTTVQHGTGLRTDNVVGTVARNNISVGNSTNYQTGQSNVVYENNSWNLGVNTTAAAMFGDPDAYDWSLVPGSPCIGSGVGGENLGASTIALRITKAWMTHVLASGPRLSPSEIHGV